MDESLKSTEWIKFENKDIIITDPCYILRHDEAHKNDWNISEYGSKLEYLGIKNYLTHHTIYGDWSCTTYNSDTNDVIGEFCADAGLVSVFDLEEVLKYNPNFDYHIDRPWTTTLIKGFTGMIRIEVTLDDPDATYDMEKYSVHVVGKGNVNFYTEQTGF